MGYSEKMKELYPATRERALARNTDPDQFKNESTQAFLLGMEIACSSPDAPVPDAILDMVLSETNFGFAFVCGILARLAAVKGKYYAGSWQKRGEEKVISNLERKLDRLHELVISGSLDEVNAPVGETRAEAAGDLGVYSNLWVNLMQELNREEFIGFIRGVQAFGRHKPIPAS